MDTQCSWEMNDFFSHETFRKIIFKKLPKLIRQKEVIFGGETVNINHG